MDKVPSGAHTWLVLWRASRAVEARVHQSIAATGLCDTDFSLLEALLHKGALPVNALGKKVLLTTGSITSAVDRLEKRGLVKRKDHPQDRRVRLVEITPAGLQLIAPAFAQHETDLEQVVEVLTPDERATLVNLLRKLGKSAAGEAVESAPTI